MTTITKTAARRFIAIVVAAVLVLFVRDAVAYCRLTTCDPNRGEECEMNEGGCVRSGAGLTWQSLPIQYRFSAEGTTKLDEDEARAAVKRAFENWENVTCPNGGMTSLRFKQLPDSHGVHDPFTIHFRDDEWTHDDGEESLALTNHDYKKYNGYIEFADIEINTATTPFAVNKKEAGLDLETVVTHEVGHYIGIVHSHVRGSIMAPRYCQDGEACGTATLSPDDIAAVCLIYPPSNVSDTLARPPAVDRGCSTAPSESPSQSPSPKLPFAGISGLCLVLAFRRMRISRTMLRRSSPERRARKAGNTMSCSSANDWMNK
jgi:hypothetical protein